MKNYFLGRPFDKPPARVDDSGNSRNKQDISRNSTPRTHTITFRAKREAELMENGASMSEAAIKADKEFAAKEESHQQELDASLAAEK